LPSSAGPFASAKVPEDLRAQTLEANGWPASAAKITLPHPAIRMLLAQAEKQRAKAAEVRWHTANVLYDSPFEKRRLRILNALFLTLNRQAYDADSIILIKVGG